MPNLRREDVRFTLSGPSPGNRDFRIRGSVNLVSERTISERYAESSDMIDATKQSILMSLENVLYGGIGPELYYISRIVNGLSSSGLGLPNVESDRAEAMRRIQNIRNMINPMSRTEH